jgi:hypothetical protein
MENKKLKGVLKGFMTAFSSLALFLGLFLTGFGFMAKGADQSAEAQPKEETQKEVIRNNDSSPDVKYALDFSTTPGTNTESAPIEVVAGQDTSIYITSTTAATYYRSEIFTHNLIPTSGVTNLTTISGSFPYYSFNISINTTVSPHYGAVTLHAAEYTGEVSQFVIFYQSSTSIAEYYIYFKVVQATPSFSGNLTSTVVYSSSGNLSSASIVASTAVQANSSDLAGTWSFASAAIPAPGTYTTYKATFTPSANPENYKALTATVSSLTVSKGSIGVPANDLTAVLIQSDYISVNTAAVDGYGTPEYAIDGVLGFTSSGNFGGLLPGTTHTFYYRYAASAYFEQSENSKAFYFTTLYKEDTPTGASIDFLAGKIKGLTSGDEYSVKVGTDGYSFTADSSGCVPYYDRAFGYVNWPDYDIKISKHARDATYEESAYYTISKPTRPAAPAASGFFFGLTAEGTVSDPQLSLHNNSGSNAQYRTDSTEWTEFATGTSANVAAGTSVYVRMSPTSATVPASKTTTLTPPTILSVSSNGENKVYIDYENDCITTLAPGETYVIAYGSNSYWMAASGKGILRLTGTYDGNAYDLHGVTFTIQRRASSGSTTTVSSYAVSVTPLSHAAAYQGTLSYSTDASQPGMILVTIDKPTAAAYIYSTDSGLTFSSVSGSSFYVEAGKTFVLESAGSGISPTDSWAYARGSSYTATAPGIQATPNPNEDYINEQFTGLDNSASYTVTVNGTSQIITSSATGTFAFQEGWLGKTVTLVRNISDDKTLLASYAFSIDLAARPTGTDFSALAFSQDRSTGIFTVTLSTDWDYSIGGGAFSKVTVTSITLNPGQVIAVRVSATALAPYGSETQSLWIPDIPDTPTASADYDNLLITGLKQSWTYLINGTSVSSDASGCCPLSDSYIGGTITILDAGSDYVSLPESLTLKTADELIAAYITTANGKIDDAFMSYPHPSADMTDAKAKYELSVSAVSSESGTLSERRTKIDGLVAEASGEMKFIYARELALSDLEATKNNYSEAEPLSILEAAETKIKAMTYSANTAAEIKDTSDTAIKKALLSNNLIILDDKADGECEYLKQDYGITEEIKTAIQNTVDSTKAAMVSATSTVEQEGILIKGINQAQADAYKACQDYVKDEINALAASYPGNAGVTALVNKALSDLNGLDSYASYASDMELIYEKLKTKIPLKLQEEKYDDQLEALKNSLEDKFIFLAADKTALESAITSGKSSISSAQTADDQKAAYDKAVSAAAAVVIAGVRAAAYTATGSYPEGYDYSTGLSATAEGSGLKDDSDLTVGYSVSSDGVSGNSDYTYLAELEVGLTNASGTSYKISVLLPSSYQETGSYYSLIDAEGNIISAEKDSQGVLTFEVPQSGTYKLVKAAEKSSSPTASPTSSLLVPDIVLGAVLAVGVGAAVFLGVRFFRGKGKKVHCSVLPLALLAASTGGLAVLIAEIVLLVLVLGFIAFVLIKMKKSPKAEAKAPEAKEEKAEAEKK